MAIKDDSLPTEIAIMLGKMDGKLDGLLKELADTKSELIKRTDDHENRLVDLELWRAAIEGGKKGIVSVAAIIKWAWPIAAGAAAFFGAQALDHPKAVEAKTVATTSVVTTRPASGS